MIAAALLLLGAAGHAPEAASARAVVQRYYRAIERRQFRTAYRLWADDGHASGRPYLAFVRGFARTAHARVVAIGPVRVQGAAGSLYATVPVTVGAVLVDGTVQRFRGTYTLRRVNGVAGATAAQRRWHIAAARLVGAAAR